MKHSFFKKHRQNFKKGMALSSSSAHLERHLEFLRVVLRSFREGENCHPMWPPVDRGAGLVLAGIRIQHPAAAHDVGDHVEITAQVRVTQVSEDGAVAVHLFHIVGEAFLADAHQESLAQVLLPLGVEQGEIDLGVLANRVTKVSHAEVQMMREDLFVLLTAQSAPSGSALRVLRALHVLEPSSPERGFGIKAKSRANNVYSLL